MPQSRVCHFGKEWEELNVENVVIDRINLRVSKVKGHEWQQILDGMFELDRKGKIVNYHTPQENLGIGEYRHTIHVDVSEDNQGAIYLGFQNNGAKLNANNVYDMKIEFNPNKANECTHEVFSMLEGVICDKAIRLIDLDVAIDIPVHHTDVYAINTSGRTTTIYDTTRYFGKARTDGRLKIYDKRKERKASGEEIDHELTRVEFTVRPNEREGVGYQKLLSHVVSYDKFYKIGSVSSVSDFHTKCVLLAIMSRDNDLTYKDVPWRERESLKKQLKDSNQKLQVDNIINTQWRELINGIKTYFFKSSEKTELELVLGLENMPQRKKGIKKGLTKITLAELELDVDKDN